MNSSFRWMITYLHDLSSKPENPGIPDKLVCDDGWFETYGYIFEKKKKLFSVNKFDVILNSLFPNYYSIQL